MRIDSGFWLTPLSHRSYWSIAFTNVAHIDLRTKNIFLPGSLRLKAPRRPIQAISCRSYHSTNTNNFPLFRRRKVVYANCWQQYLVGIAADAELISPVPGYVRRRAISLLEYSSGIFFRIRENNCGSVWFIGMTKFRPNKGTSLSDKQSFPNMPAKQTRNEICAGCRGS